MTLSALANTFGGSVRPICFAVFRLMISSNFVGCSTGRSAGFAPRVRIGLHRADATRKGRDYEGMGVHEAARIGALAESGRILASREVIEAARIRFPVSELREVELKGVPHAVSVATIEAP